MSFAIDVNILLYASDADSPLHAPAVRFIERCSSAPEVFCLAWPTIMGYLRIATHPAIFAKPLSPEEAMRNIDSLLSRHQAYLMAEEEGFWELYRQVANDMRPRGNLVPDAHLAVLLRQHGIATLYTHDRDFRRFDFLSVVDPLESESI
ncbi:MAG: TA system VapC family ribonuclease toxin [Alphaproteobacteria bacterium]